MRDNTPHSMRAVVCRLLRVREDPSNWSAYPNVDGEVRQHLDNCEWYEVYDIIEAVCRYLTNAAKSGSSSNDQPPRPDLFATELNKYFKKAGIGWQLTNGEVRVRGDQSFERTIAQATETLKEQGRSTAAKEMREALRDLSRRPEPDVTGALQHGLAALECVMREVCGDAKATLGTLLSRHKGMILDARQK